MNLRRDRILRVLSSIAVGMMAFCLALPAAMILGALFLQPQQSAAFFSQQEIALFVVSAVVAFASSALAGMKYYRYVKK